MSTSASQGRPSASLHYAVGELSGKMDQLLLTLLPQLHELKANDEAIGLRVDGVEAKLQWLYGAGAVVVFIITSMEVIRYVIHF